MAIIIKSNIPMTSPGGAPYLPDLESGIYIDIDAAALSYSDGVPAASIIAAGAAPLADRSFNHTTRTAPLLRATGGPGNGPYLQFTGVHSIANCGSTSDPRAEVVQPATYGMMVRVDTWASDSTHAGILRGQSIDHRITACPVTSSGKFRIDAGVSGIDVTTPADSAWGAIVIVLDGSSSLIYTRGASISFSAGVMSYTGVALGGNFTTNTGAVFGLSRFRMYNRRLTADEISALAIALAA